MANKSGSTRNANSGHGAGGPSGPEPGPGAYMPGDHKPTTVRGSYMRMESAGVEHGLNSLREFDSEALAFPRYNGSRNPLSGNAPERPNPYMDSAYSVTEKGHKMSVC